MRMNRVVKIGGIFFPLLPHRIQLSLRRLRGTLMALRIWSYDMQVFEGSRLKEMHGANLNQIEGKLIFHAHSLEKGLSHSNFRYGFGIQALSELAMTLEEYVRQGFDKNRDAYVNAMSVVHEYVGAHEGAGYDISYLDEILGDFVEEARNCERHIGGVARVDLDSRATLLNGDFRKLFSARCSIREYANSAVDLERVERAIDQSMKAPSVCNRQSARVKILTDHRVIVDLLEIQNGFKGYDPPPNLLLVTSETGSFLSSTERNQGFIDGGLYVMSLILHLEYEGLATCLLNAMFDVSQDKAVRRLLRLPASEQIVVLVAVGNHTESVLVPQSFRWRGAQITQVIA